MILTMYGTWLPGDKRGFRTRKHREHVEGDYKNPPPPGIYEGLAAHSLRHLRFDPVALSSDQRKVVGLAMRDKLEQLGSVLACLSISAKHGHLLVKLPSKDTRLWIGHAKRHAWFSLRETGWTRKLWAERPKFIPIRDRPHQLNAYRYIVRHAHEGAYTWKHSDPR